MKLKSFGKPRFDLKKFGKNYVASIAVFYLLFVFFYVLNYLNHPFAVIASDLVSFLTGAKIVRNGEGRLLYDLYEQFKYQLDVIAPLTKGNLLPFRGLPVTAFLFIPLTYLPLRTSYNIFLLINILAIYILAKNLVKSFDLRKWEKFALFILAFWPSVSSLILGQYTPFLALILLFIYSSLKNKKDFYAGLLSGLLLLKPQTILITPFLYFYEKKINYLLGLILSTTALLLVSLVIVGPDVLASYFTFLELTENSFYGSRPFHMFSLFASLKTLFPLMSNKFFYFVNAFFYLTSLVVLIKRRPKFNDFFLLAVIITLILSTHSLVHDLIILLIPISILLRKYLKKPTSSLKVLIIILYALPLVVLFGNTTFASFILAGVAFYMFISLGHRLSNST